MFPSIVVSVLLLFFCSFPSNFNHYSRKFSLVNTIVSTQNGTAMSAKLAPMPVRETWILPLTPFVCVVLLPPSPFFHSLSPWSTPINPSNGLPVNSESIIKEEDVMQFYIICLHFETSTLVSSFLTCTAKFLNTDKRGSETSYCWFILTVLVTKALGSMETHSWSLCICEVQKNFDIAAQDLFVC